MPRGDITWSFHFFLFLPPQFFSKILQNKSRNGSLSRIFSWGSQRLRARPPCASLIARYLPRRLRTEFTQQDLWLSWCLCHRESQLSTSFYPSPREECPTSVFLAGTCQERRCSWRRLSAGGSCCGGVWVCEQPWLCWAGLFPGLVPPWWEVASVSFAEPRSQSRLSPGWVFKVKKRYEVMWEGWEALQTE